MPRKKQKPHRALRRDVTAQQKIVLEHLVVNIEVEVLHLHPQEGFRGEIQPIAFATGPDGDTILRLDRIPAIDGVPYTQVLLDAFPEFPICLDLRIKGWTSASMMQELRENSTRTK